MNLFKLLKRINIPATNNIYLMKNTITDQLVLKKRIKKNKNKFWINELKMSQKLSGQSIHFPSLIHIEENINYLDLFYPFYPYGDLFDYFHKCIKNSEKREVIVKETINNILPPIKKLHNIGYVHLDIKLENFLISTQDSSKDLILIDFADSQPIKKDIENKFEYGTSYGTKLYSAPESHIYPFKYSEATDIWCIGMIANALLTGFFHKNQNFDFLQQSKVSNLAVDFVESTLQKDMYLRPTLDEVIRHPWLNNE